MVSTPSRRRLASQPCWICLRESPSMFGPSPMRAKTLVASTTCSILAYSRRALPVISSLAPNEYTSAVSKKLIPASMALRKKGMAACSSKTQGRHLVSP